MTLRSLAQELTEPHLKSIGGRIGKVPSLLSELREAVSGSSSGDTEMVFQGHYSNIHDEMNK